MFGLIRTFFWCIVFCISLYIIKQKKILNKKWQLVLFFISILTLWTVSGLLPVENVFITFSSPQKAYKYVNSEEVQLVVQGEDTAFVVGKESSRNYVCLIVPKSDSGWKIGRGLDTKLVEQKIVDGIVVYVYQYRKTDDYYVTISNVRGNEVDISDNNNSLFYVLEEGDDYYTYYAYVNELDEKYMLTVNGNAFKLDLELS